MKTYDFADFRLGDHVEDALDLGDDELEGAIRSLVEKKRKQLEQAMRDLLREAFAKFRAEGRWMFECGEALLHWETTSGDFWGDGLPVMILFRPKDLVKALQHELSDAPLGGGYRKTELTEALAEWRRAFDEAEQLLREAPDDDDDDDDD